MINLYRRFIPNCSTILQPLTNLPQRKNRNISLETDALHAFNTAKTALVNFINLSYIKDDPQTHLTLTTDASDAGVGTVVEQECDSQRKSIAFFSAKLSAAQRRYSTFSRELLAIYLAVKHFRHLLAGRDFAICTDHKPLTTAMRTNSDKYTAREIRHLDYLSQFSTDIRHVKGKDNTPCQSGPGSNSSEGLLHIKQISRTGSLAIRLFSVISRTLEVEGKSYPTAEMECVYSTTPGDWAPISLGEGKL